ncbi:LysR family transcriptional regulator [Rhodocytophaga rosea]|uniref:LysR family transcriptional regulator n=1 Tax=Rhodocytophaga rosea TaxID=2704465 RepID=A0A6C0GSN9_9BACT|nr:LysR family transcriptional regulator [Rhodocytophaga rosea]QHT67336.1 LysR family transcriptional regulator [Rhodocytophaga rosea]QHT70804.1 LysR family transcriptional regulator [Rhodocytophaga rosea]
MHYTLHQLKIFTVVAKHSSITRASEQLNMTQPAVSIQLRNLQDQFDIPLTEIIGRKLYITEFGKELVTIAESILASTEEISQQMLARKGLLTGKIKFSIVSTGKYIMPYYLAPFYKKYPHVKLEMDVTNRRQVLETMQENKTDFALVSILPGQLEVEEELLMPNALWLVAGRDFMPGTTAAAGDISLLKDMPILYREDGSATRIVTEEYMSTVSVYPSIKLELSSTEAIKQAVIAGLGASVLSIYSLRSELLTGDVRLLPVTGFPLYAYWRLIWLKGKRFSPACQVFLTSIRENKESVFDAHFAWARQYIK